MPARATSSCACPVSMTTSTVGHLALISRSTSVPLMPGMRTSRTTTSTGVEASRRSASAPSPAVTTRSLRLARRLARRTRKSTSSSTSSTANSSMLDLRFAHRRGTAPPTTDALQPPHRDLSQARLHDPLLLPELARAGLLDLRHQDGELAGLHEIVERAEPHAVDGGLDGGVPREQDDL